MAVRLLYKLLFRDKHVCRIHGKEVPLGQNSMQAGGEREKASVLLFSLPTDRIFFSNQTSKEWHFDILIFLATVSPLKSFSHHNLELTLRLASLGNFSISTHVPPVTFSPSIPPPKKEEEKTLSLYQPPSLNLVKSFQGLALNIISRILQPPGLLPALFSIFNSAPEWGLCEARHACQREI